MVAKEEREKWDKQNNAEYQMRSAYGKEYKQAQKEGCDEATCKQRAIQKCLEIYNNETDPIKKESMRLWIERNR